MLNFVEISNRIDNPELIKLEDLDKLCQLAERYPFTAIFSQLYLKGLSMHNTIQFEAELKNHAYRIPDRSQLFNLVHFVDEVAQQDNVAEVDSAIKVEESIEQSVEPLEERVQEDITTTEEEVREEIEVPFVFSIEEEKEEVLPVEETIEETDDSIEEEAIDIIEAEEKKNGGTKDLKRIGDLERDILAHAISSSIYLEVDKESEETYSFARLKQLDKTKEFEEDTSAVEFDFGDLI